MKRFSIAALAVVISACADGKAKVGICAVDTDCSSGSTCNLTHHVCEYSCPQKCDTGQQCVNGACVATDCIPACNTNQFCDKNANPKPICQPLTSGTAAVTKPAAAAVVGGGQLAVQATAGAPGTGPTKVVFRIEQNGIAKSSTIVTTGSSGTYSGVLTLSGKGLVTGPGTVFAATYWTINGVEKSVDSAAVAVTVDEDPPSITNATTDHAFYSSTAVTPAPNAQVSVQIQDIGAAGVDKTTARLVLGTHSYPAATAPATGAGAYQFSVPVGDVGIGAGNQGAAGFVVTASDKVGNAGSYDGGTIAIDNVPPTFSNVVVDSLKFYAGDAGVQVSADVVDPAGGSGLDATTVGLLPTGATQPIPPSSVANDTRTFALLGSDLQAADTQGPVGFTFVASDLVGNKGTSAAQTVNVDRKAPTINVVTVTDNPTANTNGYYKRSSSIYIPVSVPVDDGVNGSGAASASLAVPNTPDVNPTGAPTVNGTQKTYGFLVPTTVQAAGSEGAVSFTVKAADAVGNSVQQVPAATLKIDDVGPTIYGVVVNGGYVDTNGVRWFKQLDNAGGNTQPDIDVQADIVDLGSGVDPTTLRIVDAANTSTRLDHLTPTPDATTANRWHFHVPRVNAIATSNGSGTNYEGSFQFKVIAKDRLGHAQRADGTTVGTIAVASLGKMGIDGIAPTVSFTVTFPASGTDCDTAGTTNPGLVCGHDGAHFWRRGVGAGGAETTPLSFTVTDNGVGVDSGSSNCAIAGAASGDCSANAPSGSGASVTFSYTPNFKGAKLTNPDVTTGGGDASVTVGGADLVGNTATAPPTTVAVSRVRWVHKLTLASSVSGISLRGAPLVSSLLSPQIIVNGSNNATNPIVSVAPKGGILWAAGKAQGVGSVTSNMVYDPSGPLLYALSSNTLYAMDVTSAGVDKYCKNGVTTQTGSPMLVGSGTSANVVITDAGGATQKVAAFAPTNLSVSGGVCNQIDTAKLVAGTKFGPPTASGTTVYWGYDNRSNTAGDAGLMSATLSAGAFSAVTAHALGGGIPPFVGSYSTFIAIADSFLFGNSVRLSYYSFKPDYSLNWTTTPFANTPTMAGPMVVAKGLALGTSATPGQVVAYTKCAAPPATGCTGGQLKWSYPTGNTDLGEVSRIATASDGTLYFGDVGNTEFVALTPGTSSASQAWNFTGQGSTALNNNVVSTEPTIDATTGIVYFGQDANLYALITDQGPAAPSAGADWPRTGFDNCNSGNTAFSCQ